MSVLYLQGGGAAPSSGVGALVLGMDWPKGIFAPHLDSVWLAEAFGLQVSRVEEALVESSGAVGYGWGSWLLLCAMEGLVARGWQPCPTLLLACFMRRGRFTGNDGADYALPRSREVEFALSKGGALAGAPIRFLHGSDDSQAKLSHLEFVEDEGFVLRRVPAGHLLLGSAKGVVVEELTRLRRAIRHGSFR